MYACEGKPWKACQSHSFLECLNKKKVTWLSIKLRIQPPHSSSSCIIIYLTVLMMMRSHSPALILTIITQLQSSPCLSIHLIRITKMPLHQDCLVVRDLYILSMGEANVTLHLSLSLSLKWMVKKKCLTFYYYNIFCLHHFYMYIPKLVKTQKYFRVILLSR